MTRPMTFGLVHGGAHGAWCWQRVRAELVARGHDAIAMDLPCEDAESGAAEYADVVVTALHEAEEPVVLVGHSMGGLTIPLVATLRPTRRMIFIAALLPVPGRSVADQRRDEPDMSFPYRGGFAGLRDRFFRNTAPADADWAMSRMRSQSARPLQETTPLAAWPDVPSDYIVCAEDRATNPDWACRAARERLGVEPVLLTGADHSPFLSRPVELAELLIRLAAR